MGIPIEGVPIGAFDFGAGPVGTGNVDTIVEHLGLAIVGGTSGTAAPIPIEMVSLQLKSVTPFDLGAGTDFHYVTLGGPSTGTMRITFDDADGGIFDSSLGVDFGIRKGSLTGPILFSDTLTLDGPAVPWKRYPDPEEVQRDGVNVFFAGAPSDRSKDFFPSSSRSMYRRV